MDIRKLQRAIVDGLEDVKAQNIAVFNTEHLSPLFERVIIASGNSNRQTRALASSVRETVKKRGMGVLRTEGEDNGEWIIVDCGAAVAHILQPAIREYYNLEEIWGGKAVKMKLGDNITGLVKASEQVDAPRLPANKAARKKVASKHPAARKAAEHKDANRMAAFKRVAAKGPARKTAARTGARTTVSSAATKAPARKSAPSKAGPGKAAPGKTTRKG